MPGYNNYPEEHTPDHVDYDLLSAAELYEGFDQNQRGLAKLLERGVFEGDSADAEESFRLAYKSYTGDTTVRTFVDEEQCTPVVAYVVKMINDSAEVDLSMHEIADKQDLAAYERLYDRYARLATSRSVVGDEDMSLVYFPMRHTLRHAVRLADAVGDQSTLVRLQEKWTSFNHSYTERTMSPYDPDIEVRGEIYQRYLLDRDDGEVWLEVEEESKKEELEFKPGVNGTLGDIPAGALVELAGYVRAATADERWQVLYRQAPNGKPWIDVLPGFMQNRNAMAITELVSKTLQDGDTPDKPSRHKIAVDLNGESGALLDRLTLYGDGIADQHVMISSNPQLRLIAEKRLARKDIGVIDAEPDDLPFDDASQTLMFSDGLTRRMDKSKEQNFYLELSRVLQQGGMYVEASGGNGLPQESMCTRWKYVLSAMIENQIKSNAIPNSHLDKQRRAAMLSGLGLHTKTFRHNMVSLEVITQKAHIRDIGYQALAGRGVSRVFAISAGQEPQAES